MQMILDRYYLSGFFTSGASTLRQEGYVVVIPATGKLTGIVTDSSNKGSSSVTSNVIGLYYPREGIINLLKTPINRTNENTLYWHFEKDQLEDDLNSVEGEYAGVWQRIKLSKPLEGALRNPDIDLEKYTAVTASYLKSHVFNAEKERRFRQTHKPSNKGGIELTLINRQISHSTSIPLREIFGRLRSPSEACLR